MPRDQGRQRGESLNDVSRGLRETEVIKSSARLVEVRLVDEVPACLPSHSFTFDIVSKGCALSEGVIFLVFDQIRVLLALRKWLEHVKGFL